MKFTRIAILPLAMLLLAACSAIRYDRQAGDYARRSPLSEADSDFTAGDYSIRV